MGKFEVLPNVVLSIERGKQEKVELFYCGKLYKSFVDGLKHPDQLSISLTFIKDSAQINPSDIKRINKLMKKFIKKVEALE